MLTSVNEPRFGVRAALITAGTWLTVATVGALDIAPAHWRTRVVLIGLLSTLPALAATRPTPTTALLAAMSWTVPGLLLLMIGGLGAVWLIAAASAFAGAVTEGHRDRHALAAPRS